ncbi:MAG: hypothetical protein V3S14_13405, partial [Anaerolineae bacterium]
GDIHAAVALIDSLSQAPFSAGDLFALVSQLAVLPGGGKSRSTGRGPARLSGAGDPRRGVGVGRGTGPGTRTDGQRGARRTGCSSLVSTVVGVEVVKVGGI